MIRRAISGAFRLDPPNPECLVDAEPTEASSVAGRERSLDRLHRDDLRPVDRVRFSLVDDGGGATRQHVPEPARA